MREARGPLLVRSSRSEMSAFVSRFEGWPDIRLSSSETKSDPTVDSEQVMGTVLMQSSYSQPSYSAPSSCCRARSR